MSKKATVKFEKLTIPTYQPGAPESLPMFFEKKPYQGASGRLYPIPFTSKISDEKKDVVYDGAVLENEYIYLEVLPQIGGKIQRALDKTTGYDFVYHNKVIKPAMVGVAGPWVSGGIEFNWPQHHRPTTYMPLEAKIEENEKGEKTVWVGEVDPLYRMKGMAGITIVPGRSYFRAKVQLYNRTPYRQPVMWWANLAVEINDDYRVVFPPDVEYVNDHDRRAVLEWPIAKGVYHTARPFDFGDGTDIHDLSAVRVPSSYLVSKGQSDADFISGYDHSKQCGIVTVANHHISPGKKLWHWGNHPFGKKWCSNLTDDGSTYVELMTGVYTDNQPDFTWLMPYETRTFDQYWYPVRDIGEVKNATIDAAINVEERDGKIYVGLYATGDFKNGRIVLKEGDKILLDERVDCSPEQTYQKLVDAEGVDFTKVSASYTDAEGNELVGYKYYQRGNKKPIKVRKPALPPKEIKTVEELFINGKHLEQYRHFAYQPEDYYLEALSRDPGDSRCNTALAGMMLNRGLFEKAIEYADKAIERLTLRNDNPDDTEALYIKGIALRFLGRDDEAYDAIYRAVWSYKYMSAGYYALAEIDVKRGNIELAIEHLDVSLSVNTMNLNALRLKSKLTGDAEIEKRIAELDPLFDAEPDKHEYFIDRAVDYMRAGLKADALAELDKADQTKPEVLYHKAYITGDRSYAEAAEKLDWALCFPARLDDIAVLKFADTPMAKYYLGCLYYDRFRYDDAIEMWEAAVAAIPTLAPAWRNLGLAYYDKKHDYDKALNALQNALDNAPTQSRIFYELCQLKKNGGKSLEERLELHNKYPELCADRDDCTLDKSIILTQLGRLDEARDILLDHRFHTYEGGEGNLTRHHAWLYTLRGFEALKNGNAAAALAEFEKGYTFPLCYGEEKNYFAQESHLNYGAAVAAKECGNDAKYAEYLAEAEIDHAAPTEISYFRALAYLADGKKDEAEALLKLMIANGEKEIEDKDIPAYYGVGSPCPCPFEYNFAERHVVKGNVLKAFGLLGLGDKAGAEAAIKAAEELDPTNFAAYVFHKFAD
ncbi:MAG: DUF5107 domain-containing protein [Ruminococcaceae bacterium]|nr:DUF5107 domain-containing protein [Oscillospiraceae bacterium]